MLLTHGSYGTVAETDGVKYTYLWFENLANNTATYMKLSDFSFGGAEPTGLRWMTLFVCDALNQTDWNSMVSHSKSPLNGNLHILLGANTTIYGTDKIGNFYAENLVAGQSIINAWYNAGTSAYQNTTITNTINFARVADANCIGDTLQSFQSPSGSTSYGQQNVYTPAP